MRTESAVWAGIAALALTFGALVAFGASGASNLILGLLGVLLFLAIGSAMRRPVDSSWLVRWVMIGFAAKMVGAVARHYTATAVYGGSADAAVYYRVGTELANSWRQGIVPGLTGRRGFGTQILEWITGALFALFTPDFIGGFIMFAVLSFLGQLLLYAAFRHWAGPHQLKPYAVLVFLLPTYSFWPSSIGKDAVVLIGLGGAAYAISRALKDFQLRWLALLAISLTGLGLIRIHLAGLVIGCLVLASLLVRIRPGAATGSRLRRSVVLIGATAGALVVLTVTPSVLGVELTDMAQVDDFAETVAARTSQGSIASGNPVQGPQDIPGAIALVLFRPFIFEATQVQHLFAAAETSFLLALTIWKLPAVLRNRKQWRANAYVVFCSVYVLVYAVAFSVVRNLGIIARQRGQVLAFFLVVVVILGWEAKRARPRLQPPVTPRAPVPGR